jgi:hypothetical protein
MLDKTRKTDDQNATQRFDDDGGAPLRLTIPKRTSGSAHPDGERHELRLLARDLDAALARVRRATRARPRPGGGSLPDVRRDHHAGRHAVRALLDQAHPPIRDSDR